MRSRKTQVKSQNKENPKMYFCKLCPYIAEDKEDLDMHYRLSHDPDPDLYYELGLLMEQEIAKKKKPKTLKEKAITELKLMIEGEDYHNEYVGWCTIYYHLYSKKIGNRYVIKVVPGAEVC